MSIYDLTDENRAVRERARSFAKEEISPNLAGWEERDEFPHEVIRRMGEEGFYGACFPEEYGGSELGFLNLAIICEEISLAKDPEGRAELVRMTGMMTFPQVVIDGEPIGGYQELVRADRDGRLTGLEAAA